MGEDLNSWVCDIATVGHTELSTNIVCSRSGVIPYEDSIGEVTTLLRDIENEICDFKVRLRNVKIEHGLTS